MTQQELDYQALLQGELATVRLENDRLRAALEKINGFTMSKFASHADMSRACLTVSGEALKGQP